MKKVRMNGIDFKIIWEEFCSHLFNYTFAIGVNQINKKERLKIRDSLKRLTLTVSEVLEKEAFVTHKVNNEKYVINNAVMNHEEALKIVLEQLLNSEYGVIKSLSEIDAVGHRIVHGGEIFDKSVLINEDVIEKIETLTNVKYNENPKSMRIIADHIRTSVFISADNSGIKPSNTDQGYILRRLIRRAIRHAKKLNIDINSNWDIEIAKLIINKYKKYYQELETNEHIVYEVLTNEKNKFNRTLEKGLREFEKIINNTDKVLNKELAFKLYDTYGFPIELTVELAKELNIIVDVEGFNEKFREHQEKSRTASAGKFKGGLAGNGEIETKYHTATHLLNAALKVIVSPDCHQKGSNITSDRMRFDFSCDHKLTDEEKNKTEELVNKWIKEGLDVTIEEMNKEDAIKSGAECMFIEKYPDIVTVYSIGNISKELCGGPHVKNTREIGEFKIIKEEASSAGVRRIKAIIK